MYTEAHEAVLEGKPVAWVLIAFTNPIFLAMDIVPIYPENFGGLCATKRAGPQYIERSEAEGFANVICGYARTSLGYCSLLQESGQIPDDAPDGGMPRPTVILGNAEPCDAHLKWAQAMGRYLDAPTYCWDVLYPPSTTYSRDDVRDQYVKYMVEQYRRLIQFLEEHTGHRMDWDKLRYHVDVSHKTFQVWEEANEFRKAIPSPMPTQDHLNLIVPGIMMEGDPRALDFFKDLYNELQYRVENKIGVIPDEKYRLIWGPGLPPWHTMKIFNDFEALGAVFVMETVYHLAWTRSDIPDSVTDPLERLALKSYLGRVDWNRRSMAGGSNFLPNAGPLEIIEAYHGDGVVFHQLRSCRATTIGQQYLQNLVRDLSGVPTLFLESDICDLRDYSEADWNMKINAFIDTVDVYKKAKQR
jgi:benzoyl-CoA reductase/2-hydroxyglutaryl-CoA dehydratase subunit BcrC/BadD/HgdB